MVWLAAAPTRPGQGSADARGLLAALYRRHTGQGMPTLARQPGGKPYFAQGPWHCGISHTREMVFCALAAWPVGLDAEPLNRRVNPNLAKKVLSPQEFAQWQASPAPGELLLTYWTLKEAAVKYSGQGLAGYPNHLSFALDYPQARLAGSGLRFSLWRWQGHAIALCAPCLPDCRPELWLPGPEGFRQA